MRFVPRLAALLLLSAPIAAQAQDDRIRARVHTTDGDVHEGWVVFRGGQWAASWGDLLRLDRYLPDPNYQAWLESVHDGEPTVRTLEVRGHRVSWEERHRDFGSEASTRIRFGHLAELVLRDDGNIEVVTRGAAQPWTSDGGVRPLRVTVHPWDRSAPEGDAADSVRLRGGEIDRIDFLAAAADFGSGGAARAEAPPGARPNGTARRLRGTVEDRFGRTWAGLLSWDSWGRRPLFDSGTFEASTDEDADRLFAYIDIARMEPRVGGARVAMTSGETVEVYRRRGRGWYRRPIRVADPELGVAEVDWDDLRSVTLHSPLGAAGRYEDFDGGAPLYGVAVDADGNEAEGWIRWDANQEWSWDHLHGYDQSVELEVAFDRIRRIERRPAEDPFDEDGVRVTLADGRTLSLSGASEVSWDHKGVFVFAEPPRARTPGDDTPLREWRYIAWDDLREVRFQPRPGGGS